MLTIAGRRTEMAHRYHEKKQIVLTGWGDTSNPDQDNTGLFNERKKKKPIEVFDLDHDTAARLRKGIKTGRTVEMTEVIADPKEVLIKFFGDLLRIKVAGINLAEQKVFLSTWRVDRRPHIQVGSWILNDGRPAWLKLKAIATPSEATEKQPPKNHKPKKSSAPKNGAKKM